MMPGPADLLALLPLLVLLAATVLVMLLAILRRHGLAAGATGLALVLALLAVPLAARVAPAPATRLMVADGFGLFCLALVCLAALATCLIAYSYFGRSAGRPEEFYVLLLAATLGAGVLVGSSHFASFFLGLELMSVSLFALVAYPVGQRQALEAGIKYLVLAGLSSALLAFGIALVYYETGSLAFDGGVGACIGARQGLAGGGRPWLLLAGDALVLAGIGFKLSLVPFHLWAPDVYEGAPAPAVAFLATVSKGAVAALLLRYVAAARLDEHPAVMEMLQLTAILSIVAGNLLALMQERIKRLLAYSSISHLGYLLVAVIAGGPFGGEALAYYLVAYFVMNLGAFGVVAALSSPPRDADHLDDFRGLAWTRPWLAAIFTANLLSLAGIPLTIGFIGKFYLFTAGTAATRWLLVAALVGGSVIGLFFYLRVVVALFERPRPAPPARPGGTAIAWVDALTLSFLALALVGLGVYPEPAMHLIQGAQMLRP